MHESYLLRDIGLAIMGAALLGVPAHLFRLPLVLAYIAAGVLLGPHLGMGLISSAESTEIIAEIGLVLLLFILGLEINIRKLLKAGKAVFTNGLVQFVGCCALAVGFFSLWGLAEGNFDLVYLAVGCSLSSTLIVVKVLSDRFELDTLTSRITVGILVIQDLWAILFLAIQPNLDHLEASVLIKSFINVVMLVISAAAAARFVLPWTFHKAGKQPELMLVVAVAWCFAMAGLAGLLHLSLEMGALVAGVSIASFPYQADVAAKVSSLRDFFVTLFFVSLGLQIPLPTAPVMLLAGAMIVFALLSRVLTIFPVQYLMNYGNRASLVPALNLSQISEFALVVSALGVSYGHIGPNIMSAFVLAMVTTALISSMVIPVTHDIYRKINKTLEIIGFKDVVSQENSEDAARGDGRHPHLVLLGFFREASSLVEEFIRHRSEIYRQDILVVDFNPETHKKLKALNIPVEYGDISHTDTLRHLHLEHAKVLVSTVPDHLLKGTNNLTLLQQLKELAPHAKLVMAAETLEDAREMYRNGATYVFVPRLTGAHYLADILERIQTGTAENISQEALKYLENRHEVLP